jgi:putative ABC transport system permease protein
MQTLETLQWQWRVGFKGALRRPGFLALCAVTLAVGIAASSLTFALVDDFVLTPPPYMDPSRLMVIGPPTPSSSYLTTMSPQQYEALSGLREFASAGAASFLRLSNLIASGDPILAANRPVSRSFLETLGVRLKIGRNFTAEEDYPDSAGAVIISDRLWATQFGRTGDILGRRIRLDGKSLTVVGVLPADFQFLEPVDILTPLALPTPTTDNGNNLVVIGRLAPGVAADRATRAVSARIYSHRAEFGMKTEREAAFVTIPLWAGLAALGRPVALMFFAFGMCLLVLVGANLLNLLSVRSLLAYPDRALRWALGANALQIFIPAFAEGLWISVLGVSLGLALAHNASQLIASYIPSDWMNASRGLRLGGRTTAMAVALGAALPLLSGLLAGRSAGSRKIGGAVFAGKRLSEGRNSRAILSSLVIAQVALAAALLVVSVSFAASLSRALRTDLGLHPDHVLSFAVAPSVEQYPDGAAVRVFAADVVARLARIRSSQGSAASWNPPVGEPFQVPISVPNAARVAVQYRPVTADYFTALGIRLLRGRVFTDLDRESTEPVAIVNNAFQSRYLAGQPLGQHIKLGLKRKDGAMRVIGVVGDTKQSGPYSVAEPIVYVPLSQVPDYLVSEMRQFLELHFFVSTRDEAGATSEARSILRAVSPQQVMSDLGPLTAAIRKLTAAQELDLKVVTTMALIAILVGISGLYSIVSLSAVSRKRELGIRVALGAVPQAMILQILGSAARQMGMGLAIGTAAATIACLHLRSMVDGLALAPWAWTGGVLISLFCVGMSACLGPALRAAHVDPTLVLREE